MSVAQTSIDNYYRAIREGKFPTQKARIVAAMQPVHTYSRSELADLTGLRLASVCGRVAELLEDNLIEEAATRRCQVTGKLVSTVRRVHGGR
jgi:hypothetical protein